MKTLAQLTLTTLLLISNMALAQTEPLHSSAERQASVSKQDQKYDFVVPRDGNFREAIEAANAREDTLSRFRIFVRKGDHYIPTKGMTIGGDGKSYPDPRVRLTSPRVSIIGEERDETRVTNITPPATWDNGFGAASPLEGIGNGDVLILERTAHDCILQDITLRNGMFDRTGRNIVLHDRSTHTLCLNVCLWGYQDTYVSDNQQGVYYFKGGIIRGRTDYICGKGDVYFDQVTFQQCGTGGYICAPSTPRRYGYVMDHCLISIESPDVTYYMGRPWGPATPTASWLYTTVEKPCITKDKKGYNGWADMGNKGWPERLAEYGTHLPDGTLIELEGRRSLYTDANGETHPNNPILTAEEASVLTRDAVLDHWNPLP